MKTTYDILFFVSPYDYIILQLPFPAYQLERFDNINVMFHAQDHRSFFIHTTCQPILQYLNLMQHGLGTLNKGERHIDLENSSLGILWNNHLHGGELYGALPFEKYLWFSNAYAEDVWLYESKNSVILEITPSYHWHFREPELGDGYIPYEQFIANYQTLYRVTFDKEIVETWIKQIKELFAIMNRNFAEACRLSGYEPEPPEFMPDGTPVMKYVPLPERSVKDDIVDIPIVNPCFHHQHRRVDIL